MEKAHTKILIANRGEIALRIVRACRVLGLPNIVVFSEADRGSLAVRLADEAICIGAAPASESYLRIDRIIAAAELTGATAIHPGYGFLSENTHFAEVCRDCGLIFIGPAPAAIATLGDKATARQTMIAAGVPVVPGSDGLISTVAEAADAAEALGYPVIFKATAGGGGKGMRIVNDASELEAAFNTASAEALANFGNGDLYLEKYIIRPRHVEVQILADNRGKVLTFGERDCSFQRRHQKMLEESPCPVLPEAVRQKMCQAAIRAAKSVRYTGAGTVEFLYEPSTENFYFMEMNTRLQVEHPVTEMLTGVDLVAAQILVALGEPLPWEQKAIVSQGHALEIRINAEDPERNFAPCPGKINFYQAPGGPKVRVDSHLFTGYQIPPYYDSLLAKIIVHGDTREQVRLRALDALREFSVEGIKTTVGFERQLLELPEFISGDYNTGTLEGYLKNGIFP